MRTFRQNVSTLVMTLMVTVFTTVFSMAFMMPFCSASEWVQLNDKHGANELSREYNALANRVDTSLKLDIFATAIGDPVPYLTPYIAFHADSNRHVDKTKGRLLYFANDAGYVSHVAIIAPTRKEAVNMAVLMTIAITDSGNTATGKDLNMFFKVCDASFSEQRFLERKSGNERVYVYEGSVKDGWYEIVIQAFR